MIRLAYVLYGILVAALLIFGGVADHALVEQARDAEEAARSGMEENAQMTARAVGATLAQAEQAVHAEKPWPGVAVGRLSNPSFLSAPRGSFVPYLERSEADLLGLLSSVDLTPSGLPEAVVVATAIGSGESKSQAAERLLSGLLPVRPEDLPHLAGALGVEEDDRVERLENQLRRAPAAASLPALPSFRRFMTERGTIEGWARGEEAELWSYEIHLDLLLSRAGVEGRTSLARDTSPPPNEAGTTVVSVPEVEGLTLVVTPEVPGRLRIQALRVLLWVAVFASIFGFTAVLRALRRETRALSREKAFLAGVTHELRTPLAAIRLFGETLSEGRGDPQEYGALVARESERLEDLVERVLAVTRVDERVSFTRLDPARLVRSAVALIAERAEKRSIQISLDESLQEGTLPEVSWDADGVRRALLNLLDNAVKHGRQGGRINVRATLEGESVNLVVADDGPGIERRDRRRVFGRFQRSATAAAGTGLGLYVVDQVARAHGGRVDLETEENQGATFTLILPIEPPETLQTEARKRAPT
jgi:two-component system phosphate regulon sensor histidine kinase PhoR